MHYGNRLGGHWGRPTAEESKFLDIGGKFVQHYALDENDKDAALAALKDFVANTKFVATQMGVELFDAFWFQRRLCIRWMCN